MTPTEIAIAEAVALMATIPQFPFDDTAKSAIMREMQKLCGANVAGIVWLGRKVANSYARWPGLLAVRAVWCSRYPPADGNEASLGCDDPVGAEIQKRAEVSGIEARPARQIAASELRQLAGIAEQARDDDRFRAQSGRFAACCRKLPNLARLRDGRRFALETDLEERERILLRCERAAFLGRAEPATQSAGHGDGVTRISSARCLEARLCGIFEGRNDEEKDS